MFKSADLTAEFAVELFPPRSLRNFLLRIPSPWCEASPRG